MAKKGKDGPKDIQVELNKCRLDVMRQLLPEATINKGVHESCSEMFPNLLKLDKMVKKCFETVIRWEFECTECDHKRVRRLTTAGVISFPSTTPSFHPMNASFTRPCFSCSAKDQCMTMQFERVSPCVVMHFQHGLPHNQFRAFDFGLGGHLFSVVGIVQYINKPFNHFICWLRNPITNKWLKCDDLGEQECAWQVRQPKIPASQIHMLMWEKQGYTCHDSQAKQFEYLELVANEDVILAGEEIPRELFCSSSGDDLIVVEDLDSTPGSTSHDVLAASSGKENLLDSHTQDLSNALRDNHATSEPQDLQKPRMQDCSPSSPEHETSVPQVLQDSHIMPNPSGHSRVQHASSLPKDLKDSNTQNSSYVSPDLDMSSLPEDLQGTITHNPSHDSPDHEAFSLPENPEESHVPDSLHALHDSTNRNTPNHKYLDRANDSLQTPSATPDCETSFNFDHEYSQVLSSFINFDGERSPPSTTSPNRSSPSVHGNKCRSQTLDAVQSLHVHERSVEAQATESSKSTQAASDHETPLQPIDSRDSDGCLLPKKSPYCSPTYTHACEAMQIAQTSLKTGSTGGNELDSHVLASESSEGCAGELTVDDIFGDISSMSSSSSSSVTSALPISLIEAGGAEIEAVDVSDTCLVNQVVAVTTSGTFLSSSEKKINDTVSATAQCVSADSQSADSCPDNPVSTNSLERDELVRKCDANKPGNVGDSVASDAIEQLKTANNVPSVTNPAVGDEIPGDISQQKVGSELCPKPSTEVKFATDVDSKSLKCPDRRYTFNELSPDSDNIDATDDGQQKRRSKRSSLPCPGYYSLVENQIVVDWKSMSGMKSASECFWSEDEMAEEAASADKPRSVSLTEVADDQNQGVILLDCAKRMTANRSAEAQRANDCVETLAPTSEQREWTKSDDECLQEKIVRPKRKRGRPKSCSLESSVSAKKRLSKKHFQLSCALNSDKDGGAAKSGANLKYNAARKKKGLRKHTPGDDLESAKSSKKMQETCVQPHSRSKSEKSSIQNVKKSRKLSSALASKKSRPKTVKGRKSSSYLESPNVTTRSVKKSRSLSSASESEKSTAHVKKCPNSSSYLESTNVTPRSVKKSRSLSSASESGKSTAHVEKSPKSSSTFEVEKPTSPDKESNNANALKMKKSKTRVKKSRNSSSTLEVDKSTSDKDSNNSNPLKIKKSKTLVEKSRNSSSGLETEKSVTKIVKISRNLSSTSESKKSTKTVKKARSLSSASESKKSTKTVKKTCNSASEKSRNPTVKKPRNSRSASESDKSATPEKKCRISSCASNLPESNEKSENARDDADFGSEPMDAGNLDAQLRMLTAAKDELAPTAAPRLLGIDASPAIPERSWSTDSASRSPTDTRSELQMATPSNPSERRYLAAKTLPRARPMNDDARFSIIPSSNETSFNVAGGKPPASSAKTASKFPTLSRQTPETTTRAKPLPSSALENATSNPRLQMFRPFAKTTPGKAKARRHTLKLYGSASRFESYKPKRMFKLKGYEKIDLTADVTTSAVAKAPKTSVVATASSSNPLRGDDSSSITSSTSSGDRSSVTSSGKSTSSTATSSSSRLQDVALESLTKILDLDMPAHLNRILSRQINSSGSALTTPASTPLTGGTPATSDVEDFYEFDDLDLSSFFPDTMTEESARAAADGAPGVSRTTPDVTDSGLCDDGGFDVLSFINS